MQGNPNKYIRKMFFEAINNLSVDGHSIPCFDERVTGSTVKPHYVLFSTQTKTQQKHTKCGDRWECSILLDIVTTYPATGNTGSKLLAENIEEAIINLEPDLMIGGDFAIHDRELVSSDSLTTIGTTSNVFRQLIRFNYIIASAPTPATEPEPTAPYTVLGDLVYWDLSETLEDNLTDAESYWGVTGFPSEWVDGSKIIVDNSNSNVYLFSPASYDLLLTSSISEVVDFYGLDTVDLTLLVSFGLGSTFRATVFAYLDADDNFKIIYKDESGNVIIDHPTAP